MRIGLKFIPLLLAGAVLSGCENDAASYIVEDKDHAITLIREQHYFWSDNTDLAIVPARLPDCQRRHPIKSAPLDQAQVSLYEITSDLFQAQQGDNWYLVDTKGCTVKPLDSAPADLGRLVGTFDRKDGRLRFIANTQ